MNYRSLTSSILCLALLGCAARDELVEQPLDSGKADGLSCAADGHFVATGDWASFSEWSFTLDHGRLTDSHTDALAAEDWPTDLSLGHGTGRITLTQTTEAQGAIVETVLHLEHTACSDGLPVLSVVAAYTTTYDLTGADGDSMQRNDVAVTFEGNIEGQCSPETVAEDCGYVTHDSNDIECDMGLLATCVAGQCLYAMEDETCETEDDCYGYPCIDGVCQSSLDDIDFEDCPLGS